MFYVLFFGIYSRLGLLLRRALSIHLRFAHTFKSLSVATKKIIRFACMSREFVQIVQLA